MVLAELISGLPSYPLVLQLPQCLNSEDQLPSIDFQVVAIVYCLMFTV